MAELYRLLSVIEQAFGDPFQVTTKKIDGEGDGQEDLEDEGAAKANDDDDTAKKRQEDNDEEGKEPEKGAAQSAQDAYKAKLLERKGDTIIKRKKIQLFKFWPKHLLRAGWLKYVSAASESNENINAAFLAVLLLDKVTQQFVLHCIEKQHKKQEKVGHKLESIERMRAGLSNYKMDGQLTKTASGRPPRGAAQTNRFNK